MNISFKIERAGKNNFTPDSLRDFHRFQTVTDVYRMENGEMVLRPNPFTEDWSPERRHEKAAEILSGKYLTYCAFANGRVIGEIMLLPEPDLGRMIVDSLHVDAGAASEKPCSKPQKKKRGTPVQLRSTCPPAPPRKRSGSILRWAAARPNIPYGNTRRRNPAISRWNAFYEPSR